MSRLRTLPSDEQLVSEAKQYVDKNDIRTRNIKLYDSIIRRGLSGLAFSHMPLRSKRRKNLYTKDTLDILKQECDRFQELYEFRTKSAAAYAAVIRLNVREYISHMTVGQLHRTDEECCAEAKLCGSIVEFKKRFPNTYGVVLRRKLQKQAFFHMKRPKRQESVGEIELLNWVKTTFPNAHKMRIYYRNDKGNKTYYEYDIFIPELKIAIEYHGLYWHNNEMTQEDPTRTIKKMLLAKSKGIRLIIVFEDEWQFHQLMTKTILSKSFENKEIEASIRYIELVKKVEGVPVQDYYFETSNARQEDFGTVDPRMILFKELPPKTYFIKNKKRVTDNEGDSTLPTITDLGSKIWKITL